MPGTAPANLVKSAGLSRVLASANSAPAAPSACFGVALSSFASGVMRSALGPLAPEACASRCAGASSAIADTTSNDDLIMRAMRRMISGQSVADYADPAAHGTPRARSGGWRLLGLVLIGRRLERQPDANGRRRLPCRGDLD